MGAIVFGSAQAAAIVEADRKRYGDSRFPREDSKPARLHEWKVTPTGSALIEKVCYVEALTAAEARDLALEGDGVEVDQRIIEDLGDDSIESVEDMGEVEEA